MLVRALIVVIQAANARLCRVLQHLLLQNLQLERHEVYLLLQVDDVLVVSVIIGIVTDEARLGCSLVLPIEIHLVDRVVVSTATVCLHAAATGCRIEVRALSDASSA